jgi:HK97 family phage portal protein
MSFVITEGQVASLDRAILPRSSNVRLTDNYTESYAQIWRTQPEVRTVVDFLARNVAQIGLHTFERTSETDRRRLRDHPLAQLIGKPNPWTTRYRLIDALVHDLGIYDRAYWLKMRLAGPQVAALVPLPPEQVTPRGDNVFYPEAFRLQGARGWRDIPADQVVYFRGYNPTDRRVGTSPIETLRQILAEQFRASEYREKLWRNGARFPGVITRPPGSPTWTDTQRNRFRSDWQGLYSGDGPAAGGTPILEDGMTFTPNGLTPEQAQYLEGRKLTREEVAAAYHIPLPFVGILDHATFSNISEQHKNLYQDTLGPWLGQIEEEIELQLTPDLDSSGKVYVEFNLAEKLRGSFEEEAASLQTATGAPWLTRNEARARQNLPAVEGGDQLVTPLNVLIGGQASPTDSAPPKGVAVVRGKSDDLEFVTRLVKARETDQGAKKVAEILTAFFSRQSKAVLSAIGAGGDWWDAARWDGELSADLHRVALALSTTLGKSQVEALGFEAGDYDPDRTVKFLKAVADRYAAGINATTKTQLDVVLAEGADVELDGSPADVFDEAKGARATGGGLMVATFVSGFASHEAAQQLRDSHDVTPTKTWVTGKHPRKAHAALDGQTVDLDSTFSDGSKWPGSGPDSAGCNCSVQINLS